MSLAAVHSGVYWVIGGKVGGQERRTASSSRFVRDGALEHTKQEVQSWAEDCEYCTGLLT